MAAENLIGRGIGFSPGSVKYIPTHGLGFAGGGGGGGTVRPQPIAPIIRSRRRRHKPCMRSLILSLGSLLCGNG